jgi:hypothetical protein
MFWISCSNPHLIRAWFPLHFRSVATLSTAPPPRRAPPPTSPSLGRGRRGRGGPTTAVARRTSPKQGVINFVTISMPWGRRTLGLSYTNPSPGSICYELRSFSYRCCALNLAIGVRRGVPKGVENGYRPPLRRSYSSLRGGRPQGVKLEGQGMAGPGETLRSPCHAPMNLPAASPGSVSRFWRGRRE